MPTPIEPVPAAHDRPIAGIVYVATGIGVLSIQDVIVKLLSDRYPVWQFAVLRSIVAVAAIALVLVLFKRTAQFRANRPGLIALRGLLTFFGFTCFYLALASVPLADGVSIFFVAPLLVTALSAPLLGERVGLRRWSAVIVGFGGVLLMVRPGFDMQPALLLALGAPLSYAFAVLITRRIGQADTGATLAMYNMAMFGAASAVGSIILALLPLPSVEHPSLAFLLRPWSMPSWSHLGLIASTGVVSAIGHYCTAQGYRIAPPSLVSGFEYTYFIWALALGYAFFGDIPSGLTFLGAAIVIGSGVYVIRRETRLLKRAHAS